MNPQVEASPPINIITKEILPYCKGDALLGLRISCKLLQREVDEWYHPTCAKNVFMFSKRNAPHKFALDPQENVAYVVYNYRSCIHRICLKSGHRTKLIQNELSNWPYNDLLFDPKRKRLYLIGNYRTLLQLDILTGELDPFTIEGKPRMIYFLALDVNRDQLYVFGSSNGSNELVRYDFSTRTAVQVPYFHCIDSMKVDNINDMMYTMDRNRLRCMLLDGWKKVKNLHTSGTMNDMTIDEKRNIIYLCNTHHRDYCSRIVMSEGCEKPLIPISSQLLETEERGGCRPTFSDFLHIEWNPKNESLYILTTLSLRRVRCAKSCPLTILPPL